MHLIVILIAIIAAWYRADWSRFREFHATILYLISMNLLYYFFTVDYRLWVLYSHVGLPVEMLDLFILFFIPVYSHALFNRVSAWMGEAGSAYREVGAAVLWV